MGIRAKPTWMSQRVPVTPASSPCQKAPVVASVAIHNKKLFRQPQNKA